MNRYIMEIHSPVFPQERSVSPTLRKIVAPPLAVFFLSIFSRSARCPLLKEKSLPLHLPVLSPKTISVPYSENNRCLSTCRFFLFFLKKRLLCPKTTLLKTDASPLACTFSRSARCSLNAARLRACPPKPAATHAV